MRNSENALQAFHSTFLWIEGMPSLAQRSSAGMTAETFPVEVESLRAEPLHYKHPFLTRMTHISQTLRKFSF